MNEFHSNKQRNDLLKLALNRAQKLFSNSKKESHPAFLKRLKPLLSHSKVKFFLIQLLDSSLRATNPKAINKHIQSLFKKYPNHQVLFNPFESILLRVYKIIGKHFPTLSIPLMVKQIKATTDDVIFDIEGSKFKQHALERKKNHIVQNINLIGEALLGEEEASNRIKAYKQLINQPEIDYLSVKISTIYSQISSLAYDETLHVLKQRLSILYDESMTVASFTGKVTFINLDMEEYRDLSLTVDLFQSLLSEKRYEKIYAGIVLQAYIPDSYQYLIRLQEWSLMRVKNGGTPIKIRIVKGANLEMEKHESSTKGWPQAPHESKMHTDAQFKKMLLQALTKESCQGLHLGIASHNIFDMSFSICLIEKHALRKFVDIEMLEGLAENLIAPIQNLGLSILLYTPVIKAEQFLSGIAYLVRRLDEATANGNFLKESTGMLYNDNQWIGLEKAFTTSFYHLFEMEFDSNKIQNRNTSNKYQIPDFRNSPDTDWTILSNRLWAQSIIDKWQGNNIPVPDIILIDEQAESRELLQMINWEGELPWQSQLSTLDDYKQALNEAKSSTWNQHTPIQRIKVLKDVGRTLEENRGDLIGVGMSEVGKLITEMDVEISEAIDFANYYAASLMEIENIQDLTSSSSGTNLILSPWNFPVAIPAGGILASLAAGNTVIIKPAKRSIACAYLLVQLMHQAGVPKSALHFLPAHSCEIKPLLAPESVFNSVILTGGTETAITLLSQNPNLNLYAETGGKNATIVTSFSDRDLAIKNVVDSAFGNTGQKCSATSLLILEREVGTSQFFELLVDAVKSKKVGSPWDLDTKIGPLANPVQGNFENELLKQENWLLRGEIKEKYQVSPFIKTMVTQSDSCFQNELFGPHLSIVMVDNLPQAVQIANSVSFGLTSGIESLNEEEIDYWKNNIQAGNLYINRSTTGAIVKRQPFGGIKLSSFGPGMKAGGKNYLLQLLSHSLVKEPKDVLSYAEKSFKYWKTTLFDKEVDEVNIRGQRNTTRYLKPDKVIILVSERTNKDDLDLVMLACNVLKTEGVVLSVDKINELEKDDLGDPDSWSLILNNINWNTRIRSLSTVIPQEVQLKLIRKGVHVYNVKPIAHGRIELLNYLQEQSVSYNYHRYGNLMGK